MQTEDTRTRPVPDGLDAVFAQFIKDEGILDTPNSCGVSRVEMLPMPVVIEDDLLAGFVD
ncbi:hypothetical protein [Prescottella sp. R16]|uniref:hypothetical protein n=1 Tax=Prescottella sp. R16 TaxID=3064529 RepID=UPI00272ED608|nr:hypothetical protein [Prescottella sp. R16]